MANSLSGSAQRVQDALAARGLALDVVEMPATTRTAQEAAAAIGCTVGQIAKSLIFKGETTGRPILVIASGINRVNPALVAAAIGETPGKADADFARAATGFAIGGIPPVGFPAPILTAIDQDLLHHAEIWAAAGTPHAVFRLTPGELVQLTGGTVTQIT
jgi:prolyl-tRNA editing enzyme YbaK/EbsC (Cys-tRNA(Pro) deacylase)